MINKPQVYGLIAHLGCWVLFLDEFIFGIEVRLKKLPCILMQIAFLV